MTDPLAAPPAAAAGRTDSGFAAALAIARRDLLEFVRDRRTLVVTLLLPMVTYPIVAMSSALGVRSAVTDIEAQSAPAPLVVATSGPDAGLLAARIDAVIGRGRPADDPSGAWPSKAAFIHGPPAQAIAAVEQGAADVWIDAPAGLVAALDGAGTVDMTVRFASQRPVERRVRDQFDATIRALAEDSRRRRVAAAGLPAEVLRPVRVRYDGATSTPPAVAADSVLPGLSAAILVLLTVLTMTGAFYPAIDAIAGEKERGTVETLLMAPCTTLSIVLGKFLAVYAVTLATLAANCLSIALTALVALRFLPAGAPLTLPGLAVGASVTIAAFAGMAAIAAATCLAVTTASKSGKEAQNTLTPVILLVAALAGTALVPGLQGDGPLALVPFAGQVLVARDAISGDSGGGLEGMAAAALPLLVSLASSLLVTWGLLRVTAWLLADEEILFRGPDAATGAFARPAPRDVPSILQGVAPVVAGIAGLWYLQGLQITDLLLGIPLHQAVAVLLPLGTMAWWQRVDRDATFALPGARPFSTAAGGMALGGVLLGTGTFLLSAVVMLGLRGDGLSTEARELSARIVAFLLGHPWWVGLLLIALLPAVAEELLFRGWAQAALAGPSPSAVRNAAAVIGQAALFALAHLLPERMPSTFALGLVAGCLRLATGSLVPSMVCHAANNAMPLLLLRLAGDAVTAEAPPEDLLPSLTVTGDVLPWALLLLAAGTGLVALSRRGRAAVAAGLVVLATLAAPEGRAGAGETLRVGVAPVGVSLAIDAGKPSGPSVDLWEDVALRLGVGTDYVVADSLAAALDAVRHGEVDLFLGPVAMSREREAEFDFTHSVYHSGLRIAVPRADDDSWLGPLAILVSRDALKVLAALAALTVLVGHVLWWCERGVNPGSFPRDWGRGVWEGTWWGISTLIASGCDDKHVDTVPGRILATAWMLVGTVVIALFTGSLAATLTAERIGGAIHGPRDLAGRAVGTQATGVTAAAIRGRGGLPVEFRTLDEVFTALEAGEVEAVVAENQTLRKAISRPDRSDFRLVGPVFESFDFGMVLPAGSPLRERLNSVILAMREDGAIDTIVDRWLGGRE